MGMKDTGDNMFEKVCAMLRADWNTSDDSWGHPKIPESASVLAESQSIADTVNDQRDVFAFALQWAYTREQIFKKQNGGDADDWKRLGDAEHKLMNAVRDWRTKHGLTNAHLEEAVKAVKACTPTAETP